MQLGKISRIPLAQLPTPLEELARLRTAVGGPRVFVKRDDLGGLGLGGNKLRKLEYALAEARARGATVLVTSGAVQSNHVRLTLAAANKLGLRCVAVLRGDKPSIPTGNLLVDRVLGPAELHFVEAQGLPREELLRRTEAKVEEVAAELKTEGEVPYVIPNGCAPLHGALGYAGCVLELLAQLREQGCAPDAVVTACGTGSTQLGLILGSWLYTGGEMRVIGISVANSKAAAEERLARNMDAVLNTLGLKFSIPASAIEVHDAYVGRGYALPTEGMKEAILLLARTEGVLLDPVYTGKAMAGLLDLMRTGAFGEEETVVFLHTGGVPVLFSDLQAPTFYGL